MQASHLLYGAALVSVIIATSYYQLEKNVVNTVSIDSAKPLQTQQEMLQATQEKDYGRISSTGRNTVGSSLKRKKATLSENSLPLGDRNIGADTVKGVVFVSPSITLDSEPESTALLSSYANEEIEDVGEFVDPDPENAALLSSSYADEEVEDVGEFVDPDPENAALLSSSYADGEVEDVGEFVDPDPENAALLSSSYADEEIEDVGEFVDPEPAGYN